MSENIAKHNIYNVSRKICREVGQKMNLTYEDKALDLIAELTYKKLCYYAGDLESFQKHAKRSTINTDDIKLLVRRNPSLKELVDDKSMALQAEKPQDSAAGIKRKRKTNPST